MSDSLELLLADDRCKARPLFPSDAEYQRFRDEYMDTVELEMKRWAEARRQSVLEAHFRVVD